MNYPEIQKYFGTPLSELALPDTLDKIKLNYAFYGFLAGGTLVTLVLIWAYNNGYFKQIPKQTSSSEDQSRKTDLVYPIQYGNIINKYS